MALPGVKTTILDRFYNLARTDMPGGPLIAIIAKRTTSTSTTAPDFVAYFATSEQDVVTQFGSGSQLHRAYYEATTGGATNIALIPMPSNTTFNHSNATIASATYPSLTLLDEVFNAAENARADIIVPWGRGSDTTDWDDVATPATPGNNTTDYFYADNSNVYANSWVKAISDKCATITNQSYPCTAVLGVKPIAGSETPTPTEVNAGSTFTNLVSRENAVNGAFLSVVAAEFRPLGYTTSWGYANGAVTYAALMSRLTSWSATTGKPVYNVDRLRYNPTRTLATTLNNLGVVPVQLDFQRVPRWVDGTTFAPSASDYVRLSTVRIMFDAVKLVKTISQNYIGEGMSIAMRNAFETQISSSLRSMQQVGAVNHSDFRVQYSPSTNQAYVDLAIVPAFELREVIFTVSINF